MCEAVTKAKSEAGKEVETIRQTSAEEARVQTERANKREEVGRTMIQDYLLSSYLSVPIHHKSFN